MKLSHLILIPLSISVLTGCGKSNKVEKAELHYGQMISNSCDAIDYQTLTEKVDNKETFLLTVFAPGCGCWSTFQSVLAQYMEENHVIVYAISYKQFHTPSGESLNNFGMKIKDGYTSFAIFNKGELILDINSEKSELKEIETFKKMMSSSVTLPHIFYISKDQVDQLYSSSEKSLLYFARNNCSDCQYFDRNFLDTYQSEKNVYILDCEKIGIREYDDQGDLTPESEAKWIQFKADYGLAETNNPTYGYGTGYVPSLYLLHGSGDSANPKATFESGITYFNDTVTKDGETFTVTSSYFTSERLTNLQFMEGVETKVLKGMNVPTSDMQSIVYKGETYYMWKKEAAARYHTPIAKAFLDWAIPQVTHSGF